MNEGTMNGAKMRIFYTGFIVNMVTIMSMPARFKTDTRDGHEVNFQSCQWSVINKLYSRLPIIPFPSLYITFLHSYLWLCAHLYTRKIIFAALNKESTAVLSFSSQSLLTCDWSFVTSQEIFFGFK